MTYTQMAHLNDTIEYYNTTYTVMPGKMAELQNAQYQQRVKMLEMKAPAFQGFNYYRVQRK